MSKHSVPAELEEMLENIKKQDDESIKVGLMRELIEELIIYLTMNRASINNGDDTNDNVFWGYVFINVKKVIETDLDAPAAVRYKDNSFYLIFNPYEINNYTIGNIIAIIKHEGYHLLNNHLDVYSDFMKKGEDYRFLVNIATDCEINQFIDGLPDDSITRHTISKLTGKSLHSIKKKAGSPYYLELLLNEHKNNNQKFKSLLSRAEGNIDSHDQWTQTGENSFISPKEAIRKIVSSAEREAKSRGLLSSGLQSMIEALNKPAQIKWQNLIKKQIGRQIYSKRMTINRLNRRQPYRLEKKGKINDSIMPVIAAIDVSGSVSDIELKNYYRELKGLSKSTGVNMTIIQFDSEVKDVKKIDKMTKNDISITGRGGTTFQSIFNYLKESKLDKSSQIFFFTDGGGELTIETYGYNNYFWVMDKDQILSVENNKRPIFKINSYEK